MANQQESSEEYLTYQQFNDMALATATAQKLTSSGIPNTIHDGSKAFDVSFANNTVNNSISLKVRGSDFQKADAVLQESFKQTLEDTDKNYYLFQFSDKELYEVIAKPDEWGPFNYQLAQHILTEKGKPIDSSEIDLLKFRRLNELAEPEPLKEVWLLLGYAAAFLGGFISIWGGFVGIIAGWALAYSKKTLPDGIRVFSYNTAARNHGKVMMAIAVVTSVVFLLLRLWWLGRLI